MHLSGLDRSNGTSNLAFESFGIRRKELYGRGARGENARRIPLLVCIFVQILIIKIRCNDIREEFSVCQMMELSAKCHPGGGLGHENPLTLETESVASAGWFA